MEICEKAELRGDTEDGSREKGVDFEIRGYLLVVLRRFGVSAADDSDDNKGREERRRASKTTSKFGPQV